MVWRTIRGNDKLLRFPSFKDDVIQKENQFDLFVFVFMCLYVHHLVGGAFNSSRRWWNNKQWNNNNNNNVDDDYSIDIIIVRECHRSSYASSCPVSSGLRVQKQRNRRLPWRRHSKCHPFLVIIQSTRHQIVSLSLSHSVSIFRRRKRVKIYRSLNVDERLTRNIRTIGNVVMQTAPLKSWLKTL